MTYNKFLPLAVLLISALLLELFFFYPKMFYVVIVIMVLLFMFVIRQFIKAGLRKENWWNFAILPSLFFLCTITLSLIIPNTAVIQILFFINIIFQYFYFRIIFYYLIHESKYKKGSLENISSYGNFLIYYYLASSIFGLHVYLGVKIWLLMLFLLIATALIIYQVLWVNRIEIQRGILYILLMCLCLIQIAWSASFLTLSFYILGLILAICYYILIGLVRFYLIGNLNKSLIKIYLLFGLSSIILVLLTSNWLSFN